MAATLLQALLKHHHQKYPRSDEQTYHAIVERLVELARDKRNMRVSSHAAARGDLGDLARKRLPDLIAIESDIVPGQAAHVGGVSPSGYPLRADGELAAASGSQDACVARNGFYAEGPTFTMLRAMVDLLRPGGHLCIAFIRAQARMDSSTRHTTRTPLAHGAYARTQRAPGREALCCPCLPPPR